jgi:hypothetical protein
VFVLFAKKFFEHFHGPHQYLTGFTAVGRAYYTGPFQLIHNTTGTVVSEVHFSLKQ